MFILKNGTIDCIVTGGRRYSADLPKGGFENPCKLLFSGKREESNKLKHFLFCKATSVYEKRKKFERKK